jgi:pimeloyl-ACP methyl ester carboxylesterase
VPHDVLPESLLDVGLDGIPLPKITAQQVRTARPQAPGRRAAPWFRRAGGSERAVLCGYSEGGPMSILMAATYPERVEALVLYGT